MPHSPKSSSTTTHWSYFIISQIMQLFLNKTTSSLYTLRFKEPDLWIQQGGFCKSLTVVLAEPTDSLMACYCLNSIEKKEINLIRSTKKNLSIKARNLCVCVCLYVCLKDLCRSGSDWSESFNMAAVWFKGVQRRICLGYNDTVNKWFNKCFTNSASIVNHSHHSHMRTRANHCTP